MTYSREISAEHLKGFGEVVNEYAVLESHLETMIMFLCKGEAAAMEPLITLISGKSKRDFLIAIMTKLQRPTQDERKEFFDLMDRVKTLGEFRNLIAHQTWIQGKKPNTIKPTRISVSQVIKVLGPDDGPEYLPDEFKRVADDIRETQRHLIKFWTRLGYSSPAPFDPGKKL